MEETTPLKLLVFTVLSRLLLSTSAEGRSPEEIKMLSCCGVFVFSLGVKENRLLKKRFVGKAKISARHSTALN